MRARLGFRGVASALALASFGFAGCGAVEASSSDFGWMNGRAEQRSDGSGALRVRWERQLVTPDDGENLFDTDFVPVELSAAALDPGRNRVYVGASDGAVRGLDLDGRELFRYETGAPIESPLVIDRERGTIYVVSVDGKVFALADDTGEPDWTKELTVPTRQEPLLTEDAIYIISETDQVFALNRADGELLFSYKRDEVGDDAFAIAGHAGLARYQNTLITGLTDGTIVAIDATDGSLKWELPTSIDVEAAEGQTIEFHDVDTTPVVSEEGLVYAASFAAGLYAIRVGSGTVEWRDAEMTGITGLALAGRYLVVASADSGISLVERHSREVAWQRDVQRGAPSQPILTRDGLVLIGESRGSMVALSLSSGQEMSRIDSGFGFSAPPRVSGPYGWVLSNGGRLFAFGVRR